MEALAEGVAELEAKAALHSLLAQAMNYPDAKLVDSLRKGKFAGALNESLAVLDDTSLKADIEKCRKEYLRKDSLDKSADKEEMLLELERDYTRMFFSSKPRLAYLFESVYREGELLQESTFEIAGLYRDAGLVLNEDFRLPPDHIAVELEFLSFLVFKEIEGLKNGNKETVEYAKELQEAVINKHLRSFALNVGERVAQHARAPFYRTVAQVLQQYFSKDVSA
jgi:TorA maturation chaperone TorD